MRSSIRKAQIAVLNLEEFAEVEQPEFFESGDDIVPTGDPADNPLGKRPGSEGAETSDDIFPETGDPDSGDAVAHVSYPSNVKDGRAAYKSKTLRKKKMIAEEIGETLSDLSSAMHELREVEEALANRDARAEQEEVDESAAYDEAMAAASKASGVSKALSSHMAKHKDKQGSTEHHRGGAAAGQEGSKGLFEGRPYGIGDLSGDQLAEITGDDRDKSPLGTDFFRTLPDGTEVAVTRQGDGQYHVAPTASAEGSPEQDEPTTEDDWGSLPSSDPKVADEEWGSLPGGGQAHTGQGERDDEFGDDGEDDDEPKWMSYPDGPLQHRIAEREEEAARAAEAQTGPRMPSEKQHPVPRWGDPVKDPGRG